MSLRPADLAAFAALGITEAVLAQAHIRRVDNDEGRLAVATKRHGNMAGLLFPYLHPVSHHTTAYRLRRDFPDIEQGQPVHKYLSAAGERKYLYFPPACDQLLADLTVPILLCEAEKSVLSLWCAAQSLDRTLLPIGTGGCYGWRSSRIGKVDSPTGGSVNEAGPLPDFDLVTWTDRTAIIAFDANTLANPKVKYARRQLAESLLARGAIVRLLNLPVEEGINGPDDYIGKHGAASFFALLDDAHLFVHDIQDEVTRELNKTHFVIRMGSDDIIATEDGDDLFFQQEQSLKLRYANQMVKIGDKKDGSPIMATKFAIWRSHPKRRSYRQIVFAPPPKTARSTDYNLWTGFAEAPDAQPDPETRCNAYLDMIQDVICSGNVEHFRYLIHLMAFTVQQPGVPSEVAVVLKGQRGAGKGVFIRNFGMLFGKHFAHISKPEQIVGKFNATCSSKILVFADEAFFAGDKKDLGALKVIITEPTIIIERKGIDPITEPNFMHLFMASNEDWHTPAGFNERRFFVLSVSDMHLQDDEYFGAIQNQMNHGGRAALLAYLQSIEITPEIRSELRHAPVTDELRVQQELSMSHETRFWKECLSMGRIGHVEGWPEDVSVEEVHKAYITWCDALKINRRVTIIDLGRRVLEPWLGPRRKMGGTYRRPLLPLHPARMKFDAIAGTKTPWDEESPNDPNE